MALDLSFSSSSGLEQGFRAQRVMDGYRTQLGTEAVRARAQGFCLEHLRPCFR